MDIYQTLLSELLKRIVSGMSESSALFATIMSTRLSRTQTEVLLTHLKWALELHKRKGTPLPQVACPPAETTETTSHTSSDTTEGIIMSVSLLEALHPEVAPTITSANKRGS